MKTKIKKIIKNILFPIIGCLIFLFIIFYLVDVKILFNIFKKVNYWYLVPVFFLTFLLLGFKAWRWKMLMKKQEIEYSFKKSFSFYSVASFFSLATPGKIGEIVKIFYLQNDGHSINKSLVTIIIDRIFDFLFLIFLILIGFLIFIQIFFSEIVYLCLIILICVILFYFILKTKIYLKLIYFFVPQKHHENIFIHLQDFKDNFKKYNYKNYLLGFGATFLAWLVYLVQIYFLSLALGLRLNIFYLIPMIAVANATDLLPISFNGLGTREAVFIFFFGLINLSPEKATALGILQLFTVFSAAIIGFFYWIFNPINFKTLSKKV